MTPLQFAALLEAIIAISLEGTVRTVTLFVAVITGVLAQLAWFASRTRP